MKKIINAGVRIQMRSCVLYAKTTWRPRHGKEETVT